VPRWRRDTYALAFGNTYSDTNRNAVRNPVGHAKCNSECYADSDCHRHGNAYDNAQSDAEAAPRRILGQRHRDSRIQAKNLCC
jgi:hypothetical protein